VNVCSELLLTASTIPMEATLALSAAGQRPFDVVDRASPFRYRPRY